MIKFMLTRFCLSLIAVTAIFLLPACQKDEDNSNEPNTETETKGSASDYIASETGTFYTENFPAETAQAESRPSIENIQGNRTVVIGGSNTLSISYSDSKDDIKEILIGVSDKEGYFIINDFKKDSSSIKLPVLLKQSAEGSFSLMVALRDNENNLSTHYSIPVTTLEAGTGDLQISLSWNQFNDLDLHLELPDNNEIYYENIMGLSDSLNKAVWDKIEETHTEVQLFEMDEKDYFNAYVKASEEIKSITHGGVLDVDSNGGCKLDSINNENISFKAGSNIMHGEYTVRVDFFNDCTGNKKTDYTVVARYKGELIAPTSGSNPFTGTFNPNTYDKGEKGSGIETMRFSIASEGTSRLAQFSFKKPILKAVKFQIK